jgi:hypothetical protein
MRRASAKRAGFAAHPLAESARRLTFPPKKRNAGVPALLEGDAARRGTVAAYALQAAAFGDVAHVELDARPHFVVRAEPRAEASAARGPGIGLCDERRSAPYPIQALGLVIRAEIGPERISRCRPGRDGRRKVPEFPASTAAKVPSPGRRGARSAQAQHAGCAAR